MTQSHEGRKRAFFSVFYTTQSQIWESVMDSCIHHAVSICPFLLMMTPIFLGLLPPHSLSVPVLWKEFLAYHLQG